MTKKKKVENTFTPVSELAKKGVNKTGVCYENEPCSSNTCTDCNNKGCINVITKRKKFAPVDDCKHIEEEKSYEIKLIPMQLTTGEFITESIKTEIKTCKACGLIRKESLQVMQIKARNKYCKDNKFLTLEQIRWYSNNIMDRTLIISNDINKIIRDFNSKFIDLCDTSYVQTPADDFIMRKSILKYYIIKYRVINDKNIHISAEESKDMYNTIIENGIHVLLNKDGVPNPAMWIELGVKAAFKYDEHGKIIYGIRIGNSTIALID